MSDEPKVPTIILKLTDPEVFNIELDIELGRLPLMRVMLLEALRTVEALLQDQDALAFQKKMEQAARTQNLVRKPLIKM